MSAPARPSTELGVFLRSRRERVTPEMVGLQRGQGLRRTPGLRREELAALAGVSIDYYVRLERGSERHPSAAVINALARALILDDDELAHLRGLAANVDRTDHAPTVATRHVRSGVRILLEGLRPFPAYVTNRIGNVLAWNPGGLRMLPGLTDWPQTKRNMPRYAFLHPAARSLYVNWDTQVTGLVSGLRQLAAIEPDAKDLRDLVGELLVKSPEFARMWDRYDIDAYRRGSKRLHHPVVGDLDATYQVMRLDGTDGQSLLSYYAEVGTPAHDAFVLLDGLALDEPVDTDTIVDVESSTDHAQGQ